MRKESMMCDLSSFARKCAKSILKANFMLDPKSTLRILTKQEIHAQNIISILQKPGLTRTSAEIETLCKEYQSIAFFCSLIVRQGDQSGFKNCCRYLRYEQIGRNEYVFREGDIGEQFYIILRGKVQVLQKSQYSKKDVALCELAAGTSFGELAMPVGSNRRRTASILCLENCEFGTLTRNHYNGILRNIHKQAQQKLKNLLQQQDLFANCAQFNDNLFYAMTMQVFPKGQVVFRQGEKAKKMYLVESGDFKLLTRVETICSSVKNLEVAILSRGSLLGEIGFILQEDHQYTCICHSQNSVVYGIDLQRFIQWVGSEDIINEMKEKVRQVQLMRQNRLAALPAYEKQLADQQKNRKNVVDEDGGFELDQVKYLSRYSSDSNLSAVKQQAQIQAREMIKSATSKTHARAVLKKPGLPPILSLERSLPASVRSLSPVSPKKKKLKRRTVNIHMDLLRKKNMSQSKFNNKRKFSN